MGILNNNGGEVRRSEDFNRILLFHPQNNMTYIRKLTMSYGYYVALAVVDDYDYVTHVGVSNSFQIVNFDELSSDEKNILGPVRCSNLASDDLMSIYRINEVLKLNKPFKLHKACRSMRYTTSLETNEIKKLIIATLNTNDCGVEKVKQDFEYNNIYSEKVELDLDNINLTDEVNNIELELFNNLEATGQTRLI